MQKSPRSNGDTFPLACRAQCWLAVNGTDVQTSALLQPDMSNGISLEPEALSSEPLLWCSSRVIMAAMQDTVYTKKKALMNSELEKCQNVHTSLAGVGFAQVHPTSLCSLQFLHNRSDQGQTSQVKK